DKIAQDFYLAAGARKQDVTPNLTRYQIAELNKYADSLPFFSADRREFKEATRLAELTNKARNVQAPAPLQDKQSRAHDPLLASERLEIRTNSERHRDTFSRGR